MTMSEETQVYVPELQREDGWTNEVTYMGTSRDKTQYTEFQRNWPLSDAALEALYHGEDLASTVVDTVPEEMFRAGFDLDLDGDSKLAEAVEEELERLGAIAKLEEADVWGRLYGGAAVILGADDGQGAWAPLNPDRIKKLDWLMVIDRRYMSPNTFYREGPNSGEPETYLVHQPGSSQSTQLQGTFVIHESRMLIFRGARTSLLERQARNYWDHSILQRPFDVIRSFATGFRAVEVLLTDGPQGVYKVKGLATYLAHGGMAKLQARVQLVDLCRSFMRAIVVDADTEGFERQQITFTGIDEILDRLMLRLSASVRIPVTILMGQSPAGMNATGESDFRWFYDRIETRQRTYLTPRLRRLVRLILASKDFGAKQPKAVKIEYGPLWRPSAKEQAEINELQARATSAYIQADVLTPEEAALSPNFPEEYEIDRESREAAQEATALARAERVLNPPKPIAPGAPGQEPNEEESEEESEDSAE